MTLLYNPNSTNSVSIRVKPGTWRTLLSSQSTALLGPRLEGATRLKHATDPVSVMLLSEQTRPLTDELCDGIVPCGIYYRVLSLTPPRERILNI